MSTERRVTSLDVARKVGVSRTTVSLVLNDVQGIKISPETRKKVLNAVDELGYIPNATAQALASKKARAIGLVMTRSPSHIATDTFLPQVLGGLMEAMRDQKLRLLFESVEEEHQNKVYLKLARAKHIDGMILLTPRLDDMALQRLEEEDINAVLLGTLKDTNLYSVDVDNRSASAEATQHLIDLGHQQIAFISPAPRSYTASEDRLRGYMDAMAQGNLPVDRDLIHYADFSPESGYNVARQLLDAGKDFSAIFVASDNVAFGVLSALREAGLGIPEDVSIVGFDDLPLSRYTDPPLTTLRLPAEALAVAATEMLLDLMRGGKPETRNLVLDTELVIRKSSRALT